MKKHFLFLDFETYSEADLSVVGADEYAKHPSTEIVCAAWKLGTREDLLISPTRSWCGQIGQGTGEELKRMIADPTIYKVAHNAGFDRGIAEHVLGIKTPTNQWICSASLAASHALPRNLGGACDVLKLERQKNKEGKKLINRYCKPKRPSKKDPSTRYRDREGLIRFLKYCCDDVDAMVGLFLDLPPLSPSEREVWKLNQRINTRGVNTDQKLICSALKMIEEETVRLDAEMLEITNGEIESGRKIAQVRKFLAEAGCELPNLQKKTVEDAVSTGLVQGLERRILQIRLSVSKTSTAKYVAFRERTRSDGRVRDLQMYHGASTGRESGTGVQPHNLPRPTLDDIPEVIEDIRTGDTAWVRALHGDVMEALSSSIRGAFIASPGFEIFAADFNAIEARVVLWMAGDTVGLRAFESGDPYKAEAAKIFRKPIEAITDEQRAFGKAVVLGSGFQMGPDKFFATCKRNGTPITMDLAKLGIASYRKEHGRVVALWRAMESAAISAVQTGKPKRAEKVLWFTQGKFLYAELPSGRRIAYAYPSVKYEMTPWGDERPKLYFWSVDPKTNQWRRGATYGGSLTENVVQGTARDLMVLGQLRTEKQGYIPLFSVHDELVSERVKGEGDLQKFEQQMAVLPEWAQGLPVKVKGYKDVRYRKG